MESALRVVSHWASAASMELSNRPCNIFVDNPTEQAYETKNYIDIHKNIESYLEYMDFEDLYAGLMKG